MNNNSNHHYKVYLQPPKNEQPAKKIAMTKTTRPSVVLFSFNYLAGCTEYINSNLSVILIHNNKFMTSYKFNEKTPFTIKECSFCGGVCVYKNNQWNCCSEELHTT